MANLLFYENPVALNKVDHKNIKIRSQHNQYDFARKTNSVILAGVEFSEAAKEYPVVFANAGENVVPVALLGLRNEENLFVDEDGHWDARYVPAFVRRYPFVLADTDQEGQRMVCIDEAYEGFNDEDGEALFDGGEPTPLLKQAIDFLEEYQRQYVRTERFIQRLKDNDLLVSLNARVDMVNGQQFGLAGLLVVDEKKLLELPDEKAMELFRSGELAWIYCHLMSLGCMSRMVDRISKLTDGEAEDAAADTASDDAEAPKKKSSRSSAKSKK